MPSAAYGSLGVLLVLAGFVLARREAVLADSVAGARLTAPLAVLALLIGGLVAGWAVG